MDAMRITEEAPQEYAKLRKKQEERSARIRKNINFIVVLCMAALILLWCYTYMNYRIEARTLLRQAKNIELAIRLTAIEYYGYGSTSYDSSTESGLNKEAEKEVVKHTDAEGQIRVLGWDEEANAPVSFIYQEGKMIVFYTLGEDGEPDWQIYRLQKILGAQE